MAYNAVVESCLQGIREGIAARSIMGAATEYMWLGIDYNSQDLCISSRDMGASCKEEYYGCIYPGQGFGFRDRASASVNGVLFLEDRKREGRRLAE